VNAIVIALSLEVVQRLGSMDDLLELVEQPFHWPQPGTTPSKTTRDEKETKELTNQTKTKGDTSTSHDQ